MIIAMFPYLQAQPVSAMLLLTLEPQMRPFGIVALHIQCNGQKQHRELCLCSCSATLNSLLLIVPGPTLNLSQTMKWLSGVHAIQGLLERGHFLNSSLSKEFTRATVAACSIADMSAIRIPRLGGRWGCWWSAHRTAVLWVLISVLFCGGKSLASFTPLDSVVPKAAAFTSKSKTNLWEVSGSLDVWGFHLLFFAADKAKRSQHWLWLIWTSEALKNLGVAAQWWLVLPRCQILFIGCHVTLNSGQDSSAYVNDITAFLHLYCFKLSFWGPVVGGVCTYPTSRVAWLSFYFGPLKIYLYW